MPNLSVPLETLVYIIEKAREFDAEVPPVLTDEVAACGRRAADRHGRTTRNEWIEHCDRKNEQKTHLLNSK